MARFDVYRMSDGGFGLDCQNDQFDDIGTRLMVPLLPMGEGPSPTARLNPVFSINGEPLVMATQFATAVPTSELRGKVTSLAEHGHTVVGAIDYLIGAG